jgi:hypothetical protein
MKVLLIIIYLENQSKKPKYNSNNDIQKKNAIPDIEDCVSHKYTPPCLMILQEKMKFCAKDSKYRSSTNCNSLKHSERLQYTSILLDFYDDKYIHDYILKNVGEDEFKKHYRSYEKRKQNNLELKGRTLNSLSCKFYQEKYNKNNIGDIVCGCPFQKLDEDQLILFLQKQNIKDQDIQSILKSKKGNNFSEGCHTFYQATEEITNTTTINNKVLYYTPTGYMKSKLKLR